MDCVGGLFSPRHNPPMVGKICIKGEMETTEYQRSSPMEGPRVKLLPITCLSLILQAPATPALPWRS